MIKSDWFEMKDVKKRFYNDAVWIPLKACTTLEEGGARNSVGYKEEYFGAGSIAVYLDKKKEGEDYKWTDLNKHQQSYIDSSDKYVSSDIEENTQDEVIGIHLVLSQLGNGEEYGEWHLHQDFVIALGLKREVDSWVSLGEGYVEVARLIREEDGKPKMLEVRAEYLKDYLCARKMILRLSTYRSRIKIVEDPENLSEWEDVTPIKKNETDMWDCRVTAIHENGMPYGSETAVLHVARTDVDPEVDVPNLDFPGDEQVTSKSWVKKEQGDKLYRIHGELWRDEWVEPASISPRIKDDEVEDNIGFIVDASGKTETKETLVKGSRWLWFNSEVINRILKIRGASLVWYTQNTGGISCSPGYSVHFGINSIGLINIYAKDIGLLPVWQQKIWSGFNVSPDGKVSKELLSSQMKSIPAKTLAPEYYLNDAYQAAKMSTQKLLGQSLFRDHDQNEGLIESCHRFRVNDSDGLFSLAKDLNKLIVENINTSILKPHIELLEGKQCGSIKMLEKFLCKGEGVEGAHKITAGLVGINELRQGDAHLASGDIADSMKLLDVEDGELPINQGHQMLSSVVTTLYMIEKVINRIKLD